MYDIQRRHNDPMHRALVRLCVMVISSLDLNWRSAQSLEMKRPRTVQVLIVSLSLLAASACTEAPSWQKLLTIRISDQYPGYQVKPTANGGLLVERPGLTSVPVDVDAIARFCLRGPKDCNYATDQMLLELSSKERQQP